MHALRKFDESEASIRILISLLSHSKGLGVLDLYTELEKYEVGRTSANTSRKILEDLQLIEIIPIDIGSPRKVLTHRLTSKGRVVAEKLVEIQRILEE